MTQRTSHLDLMALQTVPLHPLNKTSLDEVKSLYRFMIRLREMETSLIQEYHPANEMRCPMHFCLGQEVVPAVLNNHLRKEDYLFCHHRTHGYYTAKVPDLKPFFAEMYGKASGTNGGRGGSMDLSMPSENFHAGAIMPGALALASGVALRFQYRKEKNVVAAGFGEGAAESGLFWETIAYASNRNLPIIFICENNRYAVYSDQAKRQPDRQICDRVESYGVKSTQIFGNDVLAVNDVVAKAIEDCREGKGPHFIETLTYRWNSHVGPESDTDIGYRDDAEISFWKRHCPIRLVEERLKAAGCHDSAWETKIRSEISQEIQAAFHHAKKDSWPVFQDWESECYPSKTPQADALLSEEEEALFDQNQADAIPGPY